MGKPHPRCLLSVNCQAFRSMRGLLILYTQRVDSLNSVNINYKVILRENKYTMSSIVEKFKKTIIEELSLPKTIFML